MKKRIVGIMLVLAMVLGAVGFIGCSLGDISDLWSGKLKTGDVVSFYDEDEKLISSMTLDLDGTLVDKADEAEHKENKYKWVIEKSDGTVVDAPENTCTVKVVRKNGSGGNTTVTFGKGSSNETTEN